MSKNLANEYRLGLDIEQQELGEPRVPRHERTKSERIHDLIESHKLRKRAKLRAEARKNKKSTMQMLEELC